ncbi:MAG: DUF3108 domain-containing protein [Flavobacteriales bacterium]
MKKVFVFIISCFLCVCNYAQEHNYKVGEFLKYRIHYGPLNAGISTIEVKESKLARKDHFHIIGKGWTTGVVKTFFKVKDRYESYIDKETGLPSKFIRKIDEGGYTKDKELLFYHSLKQVFVNDKKHKNTQYINIKDNKIQDMISAFYYLRDYDTSNMGAGDEINIKIFMDEEEFALKLKILGKEYKKIKSIGSIECLKIRPYVVSGRVFKEKESVTIWVTNDRNHIPVQIKASLAVGSLKADLVEYKNLKNTLVFK